MNMEKEMQQAKIEMQNAKVEMQKELNRAKAEIAQAKEELTSYKTMITEMEKDRLIKKEEDYTIEFKNDKLIINGKEQPKQVTDKYRKYINKDKLILKSRNQNIEIN